MNVDPLHQFLISPIVSLSILGVNISFTNTSLFMVLSIFLIFVLFYLALRSSDIFPGRLKMFVEIIFSFVSDTVKGSLGKEGMHHFQPSWKYIR
jgi:F-type H+-transporting ATPase subunit a